MDQWIDEWINEKVKLIRVMKWIEMMYEYVSEYDIVWYEADQRLQRLRIKMRWSGRERRERREEKEEKRKKREKC